MRKDDLQKIRHSMTLGLSICGALVTVTVFLWPLFEMNSALSGFTIGLVASLIGAALSGTLATSIRRIRSRPKVFISYAHNDSKFVMKLVDDLKSMEVEPIVDRLELKVGDDIRSAVDNMIDRCDFFLVVVSENMAQSDWAKKELEQAARRNKKILPAVLKSEALPKPLSGLYYADFSGEYAKGIDQLKATLCKNK